VNKDYQYNNNTTLAFITCTQSSARAEPEACAVARGKIVYGGTKGRHNWNSVS